MIQTKNIRVYNLTGAVRGMRLPMLSFDKSDSYEVDGYQVIGSQDLRLMHKLYLGGSEQRKFARQIFVSMEITAPMNWLMQFDTYKIGVSSNGSSKMHKLLHKAFDIDDFSYEHMTSEGISVLYVIIYNLNKLRDEYMNFDDLKSEGKIASNISKQDIWNTILALLPDSYNQTRYVSMNYENVFNMINQRQNHKLDEWKQFTYTLYKLPYVSEIMDGDKPRF